jgi:hypothetical protein
MCVPTNPLLVRKSELSTAPSHRPARASNATAPLARPIGRVPHAARYSEQTHGMPWRPATSRRAWRTAERHRSSRAPDSQQAAVLGARAAAPPWWMPCRRPRLLFQSSARFVASLAGPRLAGGWGHGAQGWTVSQLPSWVDRISFTVHP